ncbi:hypothetical protein ACLOJK_020235 [Asimina triloba]
MKYDLYAAVDYLVRQTRSRSEIELSSELVISDALNKCGHIIFGGKAWELLGFMVESRQDVLGDGAGWHRKLMKQLEREQQNEKKSPPQGGRAGDGGTDEGLC